jgi:hypothetical protein
MDDGARKAEASLKTSISGGTALSGQEMTVAAYRGYVTDPARRRYSQNALEGTLRSLLVLVLTKFGIILFRPGENLELVRLAASTSV